MKQAAQPSLNPSVGDMMAIAIAAAGGSICDYAGRIHCMTDYLAISGATFPSDVSKEEMERFNRDTLKPEMDESDERARYVAIASFFNRRVHRRTA